jgi:pseudaminic acid synthase
MTSSGFAIAGREIGPGHPPYIVAELSANHNGDIDHAIAIIKAAKEAGADAVKLQTYTADTMTIDCDAPDFLIEGGLWDGNRLYQLYQVASTPWEWHEKLFSVGQEIGISIFSTPFDETAVDLLESLDAPAYKIASFELIDIPLITKVAATGKPIIMSTGMASLGEIDDAVAAARAAGAKQIALLHCISAYPAEAKDYTIRRVQHLAETFGTVPGLSDHTLGSTISVAAVALGASLIEKHLTMRRSDGGPDAAFSMEPEELDELVSACHVASSALGRIDYSPKASEAAMKQFRRSIYAVADISEGDTFTPENVRRIRPGHGLQPIFIDQVIGAKATCGIKRGSPLNWSMVRDRNSKTE